MQSKGKYLAKNTAIFFVGNIATKLIHFFLVPLHTYTLSSAELGISDLIYTLGFIVAPILMLNIGESVMRFCLDRDADYNKILSVGILGLLLLVVLGLLILPLVSLWPELSEYCVYIYLYWISLGMSQVFLCFLRGKELLTQYVTGNIINTMLLALSNLLFLVVFKAGVEGYVLALVLSNLITSIYAFVVGEVYKIIHKFYIEKKLLVSMVCYSAVLIPNTFMWWIITTLDRIMIIAMISPSANGIYAVSYKLPTMLSNTINVFTQAWSYSAIRENESADKEKYTNDVFEKLMSVVITTGVLMLFIMKPFMRIYVKNEYFSAWRYTPFLIVGYVFLSMANFLSTSYTVNKDSKGVLFSSSCGAMINAVLNFLLIPLWGVYGAALATAICYIGIFVYRIVDIKKYVKIHIRIQYIYGIILLVITAMTLFVENIILCESILLIQMCLSILLYRDKVKYFVRGAINFVKGKIVKKSEFN